MFNRKHLSITLVLSALFALLVALPLVAQDDADTFTMTDHPDPSADEVMGMANPEANLESVTSDSESYWGSVVTLEGEVGEFVNSYVFALGESAAIDNDLVLVINNSSEPFDPRIMNEAFVTVTGRVYPSIEAVNDGASWDFDNLFMEDMDGDEMEDEETEDSDMEEDMMSNVDHSRIDLLSFHYDGWFAEGYENYTIIEVLNADNVTFQELGQESDIGN